MLALPPAVIGGWRGHFQRHPPDAVEYLLSLLIQIQCADPKPVDADIRPWAFTAEEAEAQRRTRDDDVESRRQEDADKKLTAFMMGA